MEGNCPVPQGRAGVPQLGPSVLGPSGRGQKLPLCCTLALAHLHAASHRRSWLLCGHLLGLQPELAVLRPVHGQVLSKLAISGAPLQLMAGVPLSAVQAHCSLWEWDQSGGVGGEGEPRFSL